MMRARPAIVAFAVLASLLVVTAVPVAASHGLSAASAHTTCSDFDAGTLTNMTTSGSGTDCTVQLESGGTFSAGFEDQAADAGVPDGWHQTRSAGSANVSTFRANSGTQSAYLNSAGSRLNIIPDNQPASATTENFSVAIYGVNNKNEIFLSEGGEDPGPSNTTIRVGIVGGDLKHYNGSYHTITTDVDNGEWVEVTIVDIDPATNTYTVDWNIVGGTSGTATGLDMWNDMSSGYEFVALETFDGDGYWDDVQIGEGVADSGEYISQNTTAERTEQGWANLTTVTNATVTVTWETSDGSSWSTLNETTGITTAANHTFDWSVETNDTIRVNVTVENETGNGAPSFELADEGVLFTANRTGVNNGSATPTGELTASTPTLEIDINDSDFDLAQGDSVTVTFVVDGSEVGTDTLTANGTASYTLTSAESLSGGSHTWGVNASDSYGHTTDSQTFDISTPGNITFRRETPEHEVIDDREINGTIFGEDDDDQFVMNFSTTDGNVSLEGVPPGERLVVQVETAGYHDREVVIESVFDQTTMYLLNTSISSVTITFDIQDTTGDFSASDTEFVVQRPINRSLFASGGFTTEAVAGDRIGAATEYIIELEENGRYRIIIRNPGESTRVLGAQIARQTGTIPIRINAVDIDADTTQGFNASADRTTSGGNEFVEFVYVDVEDRTSSVDLVIYEYNNASNEIHNETHTGTFGTLKVTEQLTGDQVNTTWAVQYDAVRNGTTHSGTIVIGRQTDPLDVTLSDAWKGRVALLSLIVVAFVVGGGVSPEAGGLAIVATAGIWHYVEWMPSEVTAVAIGFGAITAVGFAVGTRGGEPVQ